MEGESVQRRRAATVVSDPAASLGEANDARARQAKKRTRIQFENEEKILDAALDVFSAYGFRGATIDEIATRAGMSKPNLLYYFRRKRDLYAAVLQRILHVWLKPLGALDPDGDPRVELSAYIRRKLELSRAWPQASRVFASEILQGAPVLTPVLEGYLKSVVEEKTAVIRHWIDTGRLAPIDPRHLIFVIWATTQHYADFDAQVRAVLGRGIEAATTFEEAQSSLEAMLFDGIIPR